MSSSKTILLTALIAGTLDAAAAAFNYIFQTGKNPVRVFNFIASGVFGREAFSGGLLMAGWGLFFHFLIAFAFSILFFFVYPRINFLSKNIVLTGAIYGVFIWLVMNLIVLPLSSAPKLPFNLTQAIIGIIIHMICVGIPIALLVRRYYLKNSLRTGY